MLLLLMVRQLDGLHHPPSHARGHQPSRRGGGRWGAAGKAVGGKASGVNVGPRQGDFSRLGTFDPDAASSVPLRAAKPWMDNPFTDNEISAAVRKLANGIMHSGSD
jgi:hypothetical protein